MITTQQINDTAYCCLATSMEAHTFAHSTVTDCLHDAGFRIFSDGTVREFYLNETVTLFNPKNGKEEVGIVLPLQGAQPLIGLANASFQTDTCLQTKVVMQSVGDLPAHTRSGGSGETIRRLYRLFSYLIAAYKTGAVTEALFSAAVAAPLCLSTDSGDRHLIVLPPRLVLRCVTAEPEAAIRFQYPWTHPDGKQAPLADSAGFFLAAIGYACLTGAPPFDSAAVPFAGFKRFPDSAGAVLSSGGESNTATDAAEQLVRNIRDEVYIPIELHCPTLTDTFARLINRGLTVGKKRAETVPPLFERLCAYGDEILPLFSPACSSGNNGVSADKLVALHTFIEKKGTQIRRKRFIMRNRSRLAAIAAACVLFITAATGIILHMRKPPATAGLSADAVVQGFYAAVGALDQVTTGAYAKNKAGAEYENLMTHLFVTEKMREVYERKKIYYSPEEFLQLYDSVCTGSAAEHTIPAGTASPVQETAQKKQPIDTGKAAVIAALDGGAVYGISQLSIDFAEQAGIFDVAFYFWIPFFSQEMTEELMNHSEAEAAKRTYFPVQILRYRDRVRVTEIKGCFFIDSIEPVERTAVVESSDELLNALLLPQRQQPAYVRTKR